MPASTVVIAMGAWSGKAQQWLKNNTPAFSGQKAHSIIVKTTDPVTAHCLFLNHKTKSGASLLHPVSARLTGADQAEGDLPF